MVTNSDNKKILKNTFMYSISNMLLMAFQFFLLPLYTAYLTTADYGITNLISSFTAVAGVLFSFNISSAIMRFYNDCKSNLENTKKLFSSVIIFSLATGVLFLGGFTLLSNYINDILFPDIPYIPIVLIGLSSMVFNTLYSSYTTMLQAQEQGTKSAIVSLTSFFVHLAFSILFVVVYKMGATGALLANLVVYGIMFGFTCFDLGKGGKLGFVIDIKMLKSILKYSIPIIPHTLSANIAEWISRLLLSSNFSISAVGLYSVANKIGTVGSIIQGSAHAAMTPWYFRCMDRGIEGQKEIARTAKRVLIPIGLCFMLNALFAQEAVLIMTNASYHSAWKVVPLFVLLYVIKTPYLFYINFLFYDKILAKRIFIISIFSSFLDIIFSAILIPLFDLYGSVIGSILAMIVRAGIVVIYCNKHHCTSYRFSMFSKHIVVLVLFGVIGLLPGYLIYPDHLNPLYALFKMGVMMVYTVVMVYPERAFVISFIKAHLHRKKV